ncbi:hypothetical protein GCM10022245_10810 [Streptomyces mayteni]
MPPSATTIREARASRRAVARWDWGAEAGLDAALDKAMGRLPEMRRLSAMRPSGALPRGGRTWSG